MVWLLRDLGSIQLISPLFGLVLQMMEELGPFEEAVLSVDRRQGSANPGGTGADDLDYLLLKTMVSMVLFRCLRITDAHSVYRFS
jgi:hypothetical protein